MKSKITLILLSILGILITFIYSQRIKLKFLSETNGLLESQIKSISKQNEINLLDLQKRNEELKTKNDEINELYRITENISKSSGEKDCINAPINDNIKLLLQQANI